MNLCARRAETTALFAILLLLTLNVTASTESSFEIESMVLKVYRDGLVHVTQSLIADGSSPLITMALLSSSVGNLIILDAKKLPVDYQVNNETLTVYTLGATRVSVEYDTAVLIYKERGVWTLSFDSLYNLTVILPNNATIVYLNKVPNMINSTGSEISLSLNQGHWEISYILPMKPEKQDGLKPQYVFPLEYMLVAVAGILAIMGIITLIFLQRRKINVKKILSRNPGLREEEIAVIEFIAKNGGKAFEAEIRSHFPDIPRTSLWRLVRRLERFEIVEVKRVGLENQVELKK